MIGAIHGIPRGAAVHAKEKRPYGAENSLAEHTQTHPTRLTTLEVGTLDGARTEARMTHGNKIPPRIAEGNLSSGLNHPPASYRSPSAVRLSQWGKTDLQFPCIPRVLPRNAVHDRQHTPDKDADERESADTGRPAAFFLEYDGEGPEEELRKVSFVRERRYGTYV